MRVVTCLKQYLDGSGLAISRAQAEERMFAKLANAQFLADVRPLLMAKCYGCHTDTKSGGLQLDTREHMLAGGNSGPAIKPGDPDGSLLMQAIRQTHARLKMPPGGKLPEDQRCQPRNGT